MCGLGYRIQKRDGKAAAHGFVGSEEQGEDDWR